MIGRESECGSATFERRARRARSASMLAATLLTWGCHSTDPPTNTGASADAAPPGGSAVEVLAREDPAPPVSVDEYTTRRDRMMAALPDGILLVHGRPAEKSMEQWGFIQDATFLYLTGLPEAPAAILALDGVTRTSHLFLPPAPTSFGMPVEDLLPAPGAETARRYGLDSARPWTGFEPWLRERLREGVGLLYVDGSRRPEAAGVPPGMTRVHGHRALWRSAIAAAFPEASVESAAATITAQRAVKSPAEIEILAQNARRTAASLLAVAKRLEPGVRQRETESAMVAACLASGGQGPSFWPWTMSGPNAHIDRLVGAFFRYDQGDRVARAGELVRVDIGCAGGLYGADVGRTLPVSGTFTEGQREAWDLLVTGYRSGLEAMGDGVAVEDVRAASARAIEAEAAALQTETGRAALRTMLDAGPLTWHIHGVGVESGEDLPAVLRSGMVLAYEPGFSVGEDAYYLEDMIVVTDDGHRVLSDGLPYSAAEIEAAMAR